MKRPNIPSKAKELTPQNRRSWLRTAGLWAGIAAGVFAVLGICVLFLLLRVMPAPEVHTDPAAARKLADDLQRAQTTAVAGRSTVVQADETEVNSTLETYLRSATAMAPNDQATVRDMKLTFLGDRLRLYSLLDVNDRKISIILEGRLRTSHGYLDFEPQSGRIGSLPIPKALLRKTAERLTNDPAGRNALRLPANLSDVHIENGKLVIAYR